MKKDLFDTIIKKCSEHVPVHSTTIRDTFTAVNFLVSDNNLDIDLLKSMLVENKEKDHRNIKISMGTKDFTKTFFSISYDTEKDKISVQRFVTGWAWAERKGRYYPLKRKSPLYCYSKFLYRFASYRKKPGSSVYMRKPRHTRGYDIMHSTDIDLSKSPAQVPGALLEGLVLRTLLGIDYRITTNFLARQYMNTTSEWDVIQNLTGVKIPKAMRIFSVEHVHELVQVLRNPNELSRICQHLANHPSNFLDQPVSQLYPPITSPGSRNLHVRLAEMMLLTGEKSWLIRDYISDHVKLGKKFSLKMTSETRIRDEHRKMTREIMMLGIKKITVAKHYAEMYKDFPIAESELILDKKRLMQESYEQDHCVATYGEKINRGDCCIVSVMWENVRYTMEIRGGKTLDDTYQYVLAQCKGYQNKTDGPAEMRAMVSEYLSTINRAGKVEQLVVPNEGAIVEQIEMLPLDNNF